MGRRVTVIAWEPNWKSRWAEQTI